MHHRTKLRDQHDLRNKEACSVFRVGPTTKRSHYWVNIVAMQSGTQECHSWNSGVCHSWLRCSRGSNPESHSGRCETSPLKRHANLRAFCDSWSINEAASIEDRNIRRGGVTKIWLNSPYNVVRWLRVVQTKFTVIDFLTNFICKDTVM